MLKVSVLIRAITFLAIVAAGYWYWTGPYQEKINPDYETMVRKNDRNMAECARAAAYQLGATGTGAGAERATEQCAEKFEVYELDGHWHSYGTVRPD
jgi:hypothetical protein